MFTCPACDAPLDDPDPGAYTLQCDACHAQYFRSDLDADADSDTFNEPGVGLIDPHEFDAAHTQGEFNAGGGGGATKDRGYDNPGAVDAIGAGEDIGTGEYIGTGDDIDNGDAYPNRGTAAVEDQGADDSEEADEEYARIRAAAEARARRQLDAINTTRVRGVIADRRALDRRSVLCRLGGILALLLGIQAGYYAVKNAIAPAPALAAIYALIVLPLVAVSWIALRWAGHFRRLAEQSALPDPDTPPDFTPLSNGSQIARNLDRIED